LSNNTPTLDILMYHSISDGPGPTCIDSGTFRMQLQLLAELGYRSVSLEDVIAWHDGRSPLPPRPILITFDDGFCDFGRTAWPLLREFGYRAVVFVPTGHVGRSDVWEAAQHRRVGGWDAAAVSQPQSPANGRPLMGWDELIRLGGEGVEFGGHSVHHWDLTQLSGAQVQEEVRGCKAELESQLGATVLGFAPPYGRSTSAIRKVIARSYRLSCGTLLGRAAAGSDRWDLPRIEMHYFRRPDRWRTHLRGGGRWRLAARRSLRAVRQAVRERLGTQQRNSPIELTSTK
jgi:peptidoglycan/xylan/chitin deacetylase (PgdA/CDA1 family)